MRFNSFFPCQLSSYVLHISNSTTLAPVVSERAVENEEWPVANEPHLFALEAESATKLTRIEETEAEKQKQEVKKAALRESLVRPEGRVKELEATNASLNTNWDEAVAKQFSV